MDWQALGLIPGDYLYFELKDGHLVLSEIQVNDPLETNYSKQYARVRSITKSTLTLDSIKHE